MKYFLLITTVFFPFQFFAAECGAADIPKLAQVANGTDVAAANRSLEQIKDIVYRHESDRTQSASQLIKLLDSKSGKYLRVQALEMLSAIGAEQAVSAIAPLLQDDDKEIRDAARIALERIPGEASLEALIQAQAKAEGPFRIWLLQSIAKKKSPKAMEALIAATQVSDIEVALTALDGVARLGLPPDPRCRIPELNSLNESQKIRFARLFLDWADERSSKGDFSSAGGVYLALFESDWEQFRCAAMISAARYNPKAALPHVAHALLDKHNTTRKLAERILIQSGGNEEVKSLLEQALPTATEEQKETINRVLAAWKNKRL